MDQIRIDLQNPAWWFAGVFFGFITIFINKLTSYLWDKCTQIIPQLKIRFQRWEKRRTLTTVRHNRQHVVKVNSLTSRYWSLATVFTLAVFFQIIYYLPTNAPPVKSNESMQLIAFFAPIYFFYLVSYSLLMWEKDVLKAVIKAHIKWQKNIASKDRSRVSAT